LLYVGAGALFFLVPCLFFGFINTLWDLVAYIAAVVLSFFVFSEKRWDIALKRDKKRAIASAAAIFLVASIVVNIYLIEPFNPVNKVEREAKKIGINTDEDDWGWKYAHNPDIERIQEEYIAAHIKTRGVAKGLYKAVVFLGALVSGVYILYRSRRLFVLFVSVLYLLGFLDSITINMIFDHLPDFIRHMVVTFAMLMSGYGIGFMVRILTTPAPLERTPEEQGQDDPQEPTPREDADNKS